jgi:hypothetical protein
MAKLITPVEERKDPLIHRRINRKPVNTESIEAMTPDTDKEVIGTFVNIETPGQTAKVSGKFYRGMEYFSRVFQDGERCKVPLSIARFINERCLACKHKHLLDANGNPIKGDSTQARYKFMIEQAA